jgi:hypothetical protein
MKFRRPGTAAELSRLLVAAVYLTGSFTHLIIATVRPRLYDAFGEWAPFTAPALADIWDSVVVPNATAFGLLVAGGELAVALLVMRGGRATRLGLSGAIGFHVVLAVFFGLWIYAVPAIVALTYLQRYHFGPIIVPVTKTNRASRGALEPKTTSGLTRRLGNEPRRVA